MRAQYEQIEPLVALVADVPGDFIELGVWRGDTFVPLAEAGARADRRSHAIDSFWGMAPPTEHDYEPDGHCHYPEGCLSAGGVEGLLERCAHIQEWVAIWQGWIPEVFDRMPSDLHFAFAHVDLDQYVPTLASLHWLWPRMNPGGILCCHDWFPGHDFLAAGAIRAWMDWQRRYALAVEPAGELPSHHVYFIR